MTLAKIDHIVYKTQGYLAAFKEDERFNPTDAGSCRFGEWYADKGKQELGACKGYMSVLKPHKDVHDNVIKVASIIKSNDVVQKATELKDLFDNIEKNSNKLFDLLDDLTNEKREC